MIIPLSASLNAQLNIVPYVLKTPLIQPNELSLSLGSNVYLKLENEQLTGSFKLRGALNKVKNLKSTNPIFYTASTGNHAQGFALACQILNVDGKVFMPENASKSKIEAVKKYGVSLEIKGKGCLEAEEYAKDQAKIDNAIWVSPYNDIEIIAGQSTIALEIIEQLEDTILDELYVCIGGGGLASGVASVMKHLSPKTKVIGCLPENAPEMYLSVQKGEIVSLENPKPTISDGSAGGLEEGSVTFDICRELIDGYVLISEDEIKEAIRWMMIHHHKVIEGAAAVALAAAMKNGQKNTNIAVVLCGANIDPQLLKTIL